MVRTKQPVATPPSMPVVARSGVAGTTISNAEFKRFQTWIHQTAGITLSEHKHALVMGRLASRLRHYQLTSYDDYFHLLTGGSNPGEARIAVDLLSTHETHFFREPKHFDFLGRQILSAPRTGQALRVWSAAASTGEEPYSIAMTLAAALGDRPWEVLASDVSERVLERARSGHYAIERAASIPEAHLRTCCLKGIGAQHGTFVIEPKIRARVQFMHINLNDTLPRIGLFDAIFMRNVMIYFNQETKRNVVARILTHLQPGGHLYIGHSESLHGVSSTLKSVVASVYQSPEA